MLALSPCAVGVYVTVPAIALPPSLKVIVPTGATPASEPIICATSVTDEFKLIEFGVAPKVVKNGSACVTVKLEEGPFELA